MGKDKRKPLVEIDSSNGKVKMYWESGKDACAFYAIKPGVMSLCLNGNIKHVKKKYFRFATEQEKILYSGVKERLSENLKPAEQPLVPAEALPDIPVEVIPETVEKPEDDLTPFDRLIKKGKEKLI